MKLLAYSIIFVCISQSSSQLWFGTSEGNVGGWNVDTTAFQPTTWSATNYGSINCIKFISANKLVTGSSDYNLYVWDISTSPPTAITTFYGHSGKVNCCDKLLNGNIVSGGDDNSIYVWNPANGNTVDSKWFAHSSNILSIKVLSNGNIASGAAYGDTVIKIWSTSLGTPIKTLSGHSNDILVIDQLSNGNLISGSADTYTIIWDLSSTNKVNKFRPITSTTAVNCLKQLPDDSIAFAGGNSQAIHTWEITGPNTETKINTTTNIISTTPCKYMILYNSSYMAVASSGKATYLVDVTDTSNLQLSETLSLVYSTQSMCLETQALYYTTTTKTTTTTTKAGTTTKTTTTKTSTTTTTTTSTTTKLTTTATTTSLSTTQITTISTTTSCIRTTIITTTSSTTKTSSTTVTTTISTTLSSILSTSTIATISTTISTTLSSILSTSTITTISTTTTVLETQTNLNLTINPLLFTSQFTLDDITIQEYINILNSNYDFSDCIVNCSNHGMCKYSGNGSFICACQGDYGGQTCQKNLLPCSQSPCLNNGSCYQNSTSLNQTTYGYFCECDSLYYGTNCEYKIDVCQNETCSSNGVCKDVNSIPTCQCFLNYYGDKCQSETSQQKTIKTVTSTASIIAIATLVSFYTLIVICDLLKLFCWSNEKSIKKKIPKPIKLVYVP